MKNKIEKKISELIKKLQNEQSPVNGSEWQSGYNNGLARADELLCDFYASAEVQELSNPCVVLPCKVGDKVKATVLRPYNGNTATIHGEVIGIFITDKIMIRVSYDSCRTIDFRDTDFGETVFVEVTT